MSVALLFGCQSAQQDTGSIFSESNIFGDLNPRKLKSSGTEEGYAVGGNPRGGNGPLTQNFGPDGSIGVMRQGNDEGPAQYALNFEDSDIKDVIRAILTDALQISYTISGPIAGAVTISSAKPVSREALLGLLDSSLTAIGYSMIKEGAGYRIAPNGLGGGSVDSGGKVSPGFGLSVVRLSFVPAATMLELLNGFVSEGENLRISKAGNAIVIRGPSTRRTEVVNTIAAFDADFMEDQSVSIFRLTEARPEAVIPELERIFNASGENALIQFRPMGRLRGILAISKNGGLLRRAETWVRRLDQDNPDTGRNVFVYKAKYRKATELAKVVSSLFGGGTATGPKEFSSPPSAEPAAADDGSTPPNPVDTRVAAAFDNAGSADEDPAVGPNVVDLTQEPGPMQVRIAADPADNSVVVYAEPEQAAEIVATLRRLDATPAQVAINVTIAEVRLTNELKFGVQYYVRSKSLGLGDDNGAISLADSASGLLRNQIPGLNVVLGSDSDPDVIIHALDMIGDVEVLSSPSLVVLENQTASLQVGDEVPITTRQSQSTESELAPIINQVEFKNTGIILNVTPRIGHNDAVTMEIDQEISSVVGATNTLTPTISKRKVESQISVANGQTVLLAGLISASRDNSKQSVPGLSKVPLLGNLLGKTQKTGNRTELIVLIRPLVIRDEQDAGNVAAGLRAKMTVFDGRRKPLK